MPTPILMPLLTPTMEDGTLVKWHVREGDSVTSGDVIAEVETDKATMEVEAADAGTIGKLLVAEGAEHVAVNQPIAILIGDEESSKENHGSDAGATSPFKGEVGAPGEGASSFETRPAAAPQDEELALHPGRLAPRPANLAPHPEEGAQAPVSKGVARDGSPSPQPSPPRGQGVAATPPPTFTSPHKREGANGTKRIFASPLARRLARERGLDLGALHGSGPHGRIVKRDLDKAPLQAPLEAPRAAEHIEEFEAVEVMPEPDRRRLAKAHPAAAQTSISDAQVMALYEPGSYELVPHDTMRRVIAERLTLAKQTIPHFYLGIDCELDACLAARTRLNAMAPKDGPRAFKLSVNDFIIKALAMALQKVPRANASWTEAGLLLHRDSDVAVAVALPGGGLFTPVIRNAELKSLSEISNEMKDLASRARSKRLAPHDYQGGTTTISNLGMYGVARFDAVINPPQASILAVGKAEKRPVIKDDAVKIATMMSATLSVDHRVIDGALGAELLAAFKAFIEDPVTMLV